MSNFDDETIYEEETLPEETSNRTFLIAAGILGGLVLLALLCGIFSSHEVRTNRQMPPRCNKRPTRLPPFRWD
jgi:hypothetical protein